MAQAKLSDGDFVRLFETIGPAALAEKVGLKVRGIYGRRVRIEKKLRRQLVAPADTPSATHRTRVGIAHPHKVLYEPKGTVIVFSDAHYWPNIVSTAHKALLKMIRELQPTAIVANGDVFDGASISRHPPIGWENRPSVVGEIEACQERLNEIEREAKNAKLIWTLGNHDGRFETRLATVAPEYAKIHGTHLKDFFPKWRPCWSVWFGDNTVVKHRFKGGVHATHNNAVNSGKNIVTGHLHALKVTPFADYNGTRFGVDTGTLADPYGPQFEGYMEDNARSWRSGFAVLTFHKQELLWPELVHVRAQDEYEFRGKVYAL
jgi:metallophosphoesterase superfamily enzyme